MGQYLAIGLVTECGTSKKDLQKYNITKDDLIAEMESQLHFCPAIFDFSETEEHYLFKLQSSVLENQLLSFLEKFYPLVYLGSDVDYEDTIEMLKTSDPSTWLELARGKSREEFQWDKYAEVDLLYFDKPFKPKARIFYNTIMLSDEGKIVMEVFGRQFNFFKYCIHKTFPELPIAKAIRVYITG